MAIIPSDIPANANIIILFCAFICLIFRAFFLELDHLLVVQLQGMHSLGYLIRYTGVKQTLTNLQKMQ